MRTFATRTALHILVISVGALALYLPLLDYSPPYLHEAEVLFGLHAHAIATTGRDMYGRVMPLYFQMLPLGVGTWWHPVLVYFTALFLQIFSISETVLRTPSVIVAAIDCLLVYFIARRLLGDARYGLLAAALLALTPAHYIQGRIAMDYIYPVPFALGWLLCLLIYVERQEPRWLYASTVVLGVGFYSYLAAVILMPIYLLLTLLVVVFSMPRPVRSCAIAIAGFCTPLVVLPIWLALHPMVVSQTWERYPRTGPSVGLAKNIVDRVSLYWRFFDPAYLFITGGYASALNSVRHVGVFLVPLLFAIPVGLWHFARESAGMPTPSAADEVPIARRVGAFIVVAGFLLAPLAAIVVIEPYTIDREMVVVGFGALLATYGFIRLWTSVRPWVRRAAVLLLVLVPVHFAFFLYDYYVDYRGRAAFWFGWNHRGAIEQLLAREAETHPKTIFLSSRNDIYLDAYWRLALIEHQREDLLNRTVFFDSTEMDISKVPPGSLVLMNRNDPTLNEVLARGELRHVADVPEIADPVFFSILER